MAYVHDAKVLAEGRAALTPGTGALHPGGTAGEPGQKAPALSQAHLIAAVEAAMDGLAITDSDGVFIYMNAAHARMFGYDAPARMVGESWRILYDEAEAARLASEALPRAVSEGAWRGEARGRRADGAAIDQDVTLTCLPDGGVLCATRDITGRKAMEGELRLKTACLEDTVAWLDKVLADLRDAHAAKAAFLSNISHNLITPLNAIIGFSEVLRLTDPDVDRSHHATYAEEIRRNGYHLLSLIEDILEFARLDAGDRVLREDECHLGEMARACLRRAAEAADARGVAVASDLPAELPVIHGEERALRRALGNLLDNAVAFTHEGDTVTLSVAHDGGDLTLSVTDNGPGIDPATLKRLVEPLEVAGNPLNRACQTGAGLGLALADMLIEAHGGALELDSQPGQGTRATLRLPADRLRPGVDGPDTR